jgi:hypothetical protein
MPAGTYMLDPARTFSTVILMGSGPRKKFGTEEQEISAAGEKKWSLECAVTHYPPAPGARAVSEVITVGITGPPSDPAAAIPPGSVVELVDLRLGVMAPEVRDTGRLAGGRPFFQATSVRPVNGRPAGKGE